MLVQGSTTLPLTSTVDASNNNFRKVQWADGQPFNPTAGEMVGIFDARDNVIAGEKTKLNNLAATVFTSVNQVHETGYGLDDAVPSATVTVAASGSPYPAYTYNTTGSPNPAGRDFFVVAGYPGWSSGWNASGSATVSGSYAYTPPSMVNLAQIIGVNSELDDVRKIGVSQTAQVSGDGRNAEALFLLQTSNTKIMQVNQSYTPATGGSPLINLKDSGGVNNLSDNIDKYNTQRVTELGLTIQKSDTMSTQHKNLLDVLVKDRESVNGVSLDEEAANLVKYQNSYNASIRMMTAVDGMLDRVINHMGTVGIA
jgi:flagellar hook-associated protein 1